MEWPAAPDAICVEENSSVFVCDLENAARRILLPILPEHTVYLHGLHYNKRFRRRRHYIHEENAVECPLYFVEKYQLTVHKQKCDVREALERVSNAMRSELGRDVKGLLLHHNVNSYFHTNWPPTDLSPHLIVDLERAVSCDLQELRGVDFVVTNVWGHRDRAVNLVNAIGKPVFWCFNTHVDPLIEIKDY